MDSIPELLRIPAVVLGIGLVIFVHELGHYLAARWCGVRVITFSLGFGPKLFGWERKGTTYQVAAFPLGGYVRVAGEELRERDHPPLPDELPAKSVPQRFLFYSGGVLMNVAFALVVFPILFSVGVPFQRPVVGRLVPGGPAWKADLPIGHEILSVNGTDVFDFGHVVNGVALGEPSDTRLELRDPATGVTRTVSLVAERNEELGLPMIGLDPGVKRSADGALEVRVRAGTAAADAGLTDEDRIVEVVGGIPGEDLLTQLDFPRLRGEPLTVVVDGPAGRRTLEVVPRPDPELTDRRIGIQPPVRVVAALRDTPIVRRSGLRVDDRLLAVDGAPQFVTGDLARALAGRVGTVTFAVRRDGAPVTLSLELAEGEGLALATSIAVGLDLESADVSVFPGGPAAAAGLRTGDHVLSIDGVDVEVWEDTQEAVQRARAAEQAMTVRLERLGADGVPTFHDVTIPPAHEPVLDYGFTLVANTYVFSTPSLGEAVRVGAVCSWRFLEDAWLTLKRMLTRQVSPKNMGGIIMIGAVSYDVAAAGLPKLFFFLCLLSMNLAFFNVLPVPLLDGGHLFFLLVEKLKGSPVSDRVLGYSQMVGVVLILSLMIYVTYNDFVRVFGG